MAILKSDHFPFAQVRGIFHDIAGCACEGQIVAVQHNHAQYVPPESMRTLPIFGRWFVAILPDGARPEASHSGCAEAVSGFADAVTGIPGQAWPNSCVVRAAFLCSLNALAIAPRQRHCMLYHHSLRCCKPGYHLLVWVCDSRPAMLSPTQGATCLGDNQISNITPLLWPRVSSRFNSALHSCASQDLRALHHLHTCH